MVRKKLAVSFLMFLVGLLLVYQGPDLVTSLTGDTVYQNDDINVSPEEVIQFKASENAKRLQLSGEDSFQDSIEINGYNIGSDRETIYSNKFEAGKTNNLTFSPFSEVTELKVVEYNRQDEFLQKTPIYLGFLVILASLLNIITYNPEKDLKDNLAEVFRKTFIIGFTIITIQLIFSIGNFASFKVLDHSITGNYVVLAEENSSDIYQSSMEQTYSSSVAHSCENFNLSSRCGIAELEKEIEQRNPDNYRDLREYIRDSGWLAYLSYLESYSKAETNSIKQNLRNTIFLGGIQSSYSSFSIQNKDLASEIISECKDKQIDASECHSIINNSASINYTPKIGLCNVQDPRKLSGLANRYQEILRIELEKEESLKHLECDKGDDKGSKVMNQANEIANTMAESSLILERYPRQVSNRMNILSNSTISEVENY